MAGGGQMVRVVGTTGSLAQCELLCKDDTGSLAFQCLSFVYRWVGRPVSKTGTKSNPTVLRLIILDDALIFCIVFSSKTGECLLSEDSLHSASANMVASATTDYYQLLCLQGAQPTQHQDKVTIIKQPHTTKHNCDDRNCNAPHSKGSELSVRAGGTLL